VRTEALRDWRAFKDQPEMMAALVGRAQDLLARDASLADDLGAVLRHLDGENGTAKKLSLPEPSADKDRLAEQTAAGLARLAPADRPARAALGRQVFERTGCVKCHTTVTENTPRAPSLKGIATAQKIDYLIESVLYPSKIIKTSFETERIETRSGKVLIGLVKDEGDTLRILQADAELRVAKKDVEQRSVQKVSLMPDGQEKLMSRQELQDLIAYLQTLR
jgi:putative heme-binding domain-containing protein